MRWSLNKFLILIILIGLFGCKSIVVPFSDSENLISKTWSPTKYQKEWWYATGWLQDSLGNIYFHQFTIFHGQKLGFEGYASHMAFTDYSKNLHHFQEEISSPNSEIHGTENMIRYRNNYLQINDSQTILTSTVGQYAINLILTANKSVVAHGEDGVVHMGQIKRKTESAYFSLSDLTAKGTITDTLGNRKPVFGQFWFDRQFGNFKELHWNWYSLRMFDGSEYMLFSFPKQNKIFGTQIHKNGLTQKLDTFQIEFNETLNFEGAQYPVDCNVQLHPKSETWRIKPLLLNQFNANKIGPNYWEGLCKVLNEDHIQIGWAVVEITEP